MIDPELRGRVAIVTHANAPWGAAVARALARQQASVLLAFEGKPHPGPEVEWICDRGGLAVAVEARFQERGSVRALFDRAEENLGPVSILVHALPREEIPWDPLEEFDVRIAGPARAGALLMREFERRHAARGAGDGTIVLLGSAGRRDDPSAASAAQALLESQGFALAAALAERHVRVNAVRLREEGTAGAADAANLVVFLASRLAAGISGQVVELGTAG